MGGHLLIDDVHLWTGRVLRDFLLDEPEWAKLTELRGRTAILSKTAEVDPDRLWTDQRYVRNRTRLGLPTVVRQSISMVRHGQSSELLRLTTNQVGRIASRRASESR